METRRMTAEGGKDKWEWPVNTRLNKVSSLQTSLLLGLVWAEQHLASAW